MDFQQGKLYHIYNRGNNQQTIFRKEENYLFFLKKIKKHICTCSDLIAWCLMPNHFHLLIHANEASCKIVREYPTDINALTEAFRIMLSSYAQAIQKQEIFTGSLFQQKTKSICVDDSGPSHAFSALHYVHQNPLRARLVSKMEDWEYSSFKDYAGFRDWDYCNTALARELFFLDPKTFYEDSYREVPREFLR